MWLQHRRHFRGRDLTSPSQRRSISLQTALTIATRLPCPLALGSVPPTGKDLSRTRFTLSMASAHSDRVGTHRAAQGTSFSTASVPASLQGTLQTMNPRK